jgi:hypothetical protein
LSLKNNNQNLVRFSKNSRWSQFLLSINVLPVVWEKQRAQIHVYTQWASGSQNFSQFLANQTVYEYRLLRVFLNYSKTPNPNGSSWGCSEPACVRAGGPRPAQLRRPIALRSRQMPPPLAVLARVRAQQGTLLSLSGCVKSTICCFNLRVFLAMRIYGFKVGFDMIVIACWKCVRDL